MPGELNVGGLKMKKSTALIAGAGIAGLGAIYLVRQRNAQRTATAAAASQNAGANTGIDPATGYPYGSTEDAAALANQNNYIQPYSTAGIFGGGGGTNIPIPATADQPGSFTSNAQWSQYVESYLESNEGADPTTVGNAIGKYITGQPLTPDMIQVVQNAIAIGGQPPVSGPNGNPPGFITSSSGGGTTVPGTVMVPNIVGLRLADG